MLRHGSNLICITSKGPMANQYTDVKGSSSFDDWVKKFKHDNGIMCYLDVSSLFTNAPLDETIDIFLDKFYSLADPLALPRVVLRMPCY